MEEQTTEQAVKKSRPSIWKWILGITVMLILFFAAAYVVVFHVNRFSLAVELAGEQQMDVEFGQSYAEPGVKAVLYGTLFWKDGFVPEDAVITVQGEVDGSSLGKHTLTYSASYYQWQATQQRTVRVVDTERPVITLVDNSDETILPGTPYEEEGFHATDNFDGDITHKVIRNEDLGIVTYTVFDSSGNFAYAEREIPYYDPVPPEILLTEGDHITIGTGTVFQDPGFTAMDNADGDITQQVTVEGEVNSYVPGAYALTYTVSDTFENVTTVTRIVEVTAQPRPEIRYPEDKVIYLTFDDGPGPHTQQLLNVLDHYGVKATFFVVDTGYDHLMGEIVDRGHSIGIHSVTHDYEEIYSSPEAYFRDLYTMQDIIYENTGVRTTLMRFPGGGSNMVSSFNEGVMTLLTEAVQDAGFQYFDWNVDSNDAGGALRAQTVYNNVTKGVQNHRVSVVLQHDIHSYSVDAVEDIIVWGLDNGYTFLPLEPDSPGVHHTVNN